MRNMTSNQRKTLPNLFGTTQLSMPYDLQQTRNNVLDRHIWRQTSADDDQELQQNDILSMNSQNYSRLLRQKEMKLVKVSEKLKMCTRQLQNLKIKSQSHQNDLMFFKNKLKEQFAKNQKYESHLDFLNKSLIQILSSLSKKSLKNGLQKTQIFKKIDQIQDLCAFDTLSQSESISNLFFTQFNSIFQSLQEKILIPLNTSTSLGNHSGMAPLNTSASFGNNASLFTFKGEMSVPKIQSFNQTILMNKRVSTQSSNHLLGSISSGKECMDQVLNSNKIQAQSMSDQLGNVSIKSLSKFKMADLCLKLTKKVKELEENNKSLKYSLDLNNSPDRKNDLAEEPVIEQKAKKTGIRRMTSLQQQL